MYIHIGSCFIPILGSHSFKILSYSLVFYVLPHLKISASLLVDTPLSFSSITVHLASKFKHSSTVTYFWSILFITIYWKNNFQIMTIFEHTQITYDQFILFQCCGTITVCTVHFIYKFKSMQTTTYGQVIYLFFVGLDISTAWVFLEIHTVKLFHTTVFYSSPLNKDGH